MKVVIFDDELFQRQGAYAVPGLTCSFYEHADDAVAVVLRERPALVCMDFSMDGSRSGADAVLALRRTAALAGLRIVAISSDQAANERMLAAGADDAVPKTHLRGYLSGLCDRQRLDYHLR